MDEVIDTRLAKRTTNATLSTIFINAVMRYVRSECIKIDLLQVCLLALNVVVSISGLIIIQLYSSIFTRTIERQAFNQDSAIYQFTSC